MIPPRDLDKIKKKLRRIYERGDGPVSISVNAAAEIFLWSARADEPSTLSFNVKRERCAIYVAYEWKGWRPGPHDLAIKVEVDTKSVIFEGEARDNWVKNFKGIYVRAVDFGDLPSEDHSSRCINVRQKTRDFSLIGNATLRSEEQHFEPLRLTLEGI
jgi:hypothetical protein